MRSLQRLLACALLAGPVVACSEVAIEAQKTKDDGRVVSNEAMVSMYPETYKPGEPQYLERDFEAGADFICDEIELKRGEDVCAADDIGWR